jgi:hypothetical protein
MVVLLILPFLFGDFIQKWVIPDGKNNYGRVIVGDVDHDGLTDIILRRNQEIKVMFYELNPQNQWQLQDSIVGGGDHLLWALGDFDLDGFSDIVFQKTFGMPNVGIAIYESPDSFSYPIQEVWRDTVGFALVQPITTYDVDKDNLPEIFKLGWRKIDTVTTYYPFGIYEGTGNNQYDTIFMGTGLGSLSSTIAFGDFDGDDSNEFIVGNINGWYQIWECIGDNSYQLLEQQQLPTLNIEDCFAVPDADGDDKLEFVVKGFVIPSAEIHAFIFEATGDNIYSIIKTFTLPGGDYYGGYSDIGDVDGDSIPEIVLEARQNIYIIKAAGNDSFYVWETLPGNTGGSSVRVYDIDGNGLSEVIISGNDQTRIYEYEVGIVEETTCDVHGISLSASPNPFGNSTNIRCQTIDTRRKCELKIYDVTGRLVTNLSKQISVIDNQTSVRWDGNDLLGHKLPGGIYFMKLTAEDYSTTEKLLLIR